MNNAAAASDDLFAVLRHTASPDCPGCGQAMRFVREDVHGTAYTTTGYACTAYPVVGVGGDIPDSRYTLRYAHDDNDDVRLLTETLVGELVAAHAWLDATATE